MAKLKDLSGASLVVVEIPAKNALINNETIIEEVPAKRFCIAKQSFAFFTPTDGRVPKILGTPSGEPDSKNPHLIGYVPFDKEKE